MFNSALGNNDKTGFEMRIYNAGITYNSPACPYPKHVSHTNELCEMHWLQNTK